MTPELHIHEGPDAAIQIPGFQFGAGRGGIKSKGNDVLVVIAEDGAIPAAAVFTKNLFAAAPVQFSRNMTKGGKLAGAVVNSGNANCATGEQGVKDAAEMAASLAAHLKDNNLPILVASTGIIGRLLPMDRVRDGITAAVSNLGKCDLYGAATAIMTTDTFAKAAYTHIMLSGRKVVIGGISKGAGMIAPNMGTMLGFIFTDAAVKPACLKVLLKDVIQDTYNSVTIDGDTSTNDTLAIFASGKAGNATIAKTSKEVRSLRDAIFAVCLSLSRQIARDGEGATKLVEVRISGTGTKQDARKIARAISESPLVKTALHGEDPNWGRIVAAAGRSGAAFDPDKAELLINGVRVFSQGRPTGAENEAHQKMVEKEIIIDLSVGAGKAAATFYTCDLSREYITINADYHT
jgi:glutamate N-acetyltransferase/amino-acid N-acetyltransferase